MSQTDIQGFLHNLDRSKLLAGQSAEDLWQKTGGASGPFATAESFATWLVEQGKITRYQADKTLRGSTRFFLDDYKLTDAIGTGRMAGVYRAIHKLGMPVAIKILPPSGAKKTDVLARFQRESELALKLDHRHVVKTYHSGCSDGLHYIAMELLEGETLEERIKDKGKLPPAEVLKIADQTLQALGHLHEKGMVHRDIKPGNIMLVTVGGDSQFAVKLLDVGLGRALFADEEQPSGAPEDLTAAGAVIGTPDYTAAEQSRDSHAADIRSDMYSLGCVLYECLMGKVPFPDKNLVNKLIKHSREMPPPLDLGDYPKTAQLQAWLWKMMAKKPEDRFQTPQEAIAAALQPAKQPQQTAVDSPIEADVEPVEIEIVPIARPMSSKNLSGINRRPKAPRKSQGKLIAIGGAAVVLLAILSFLLFNAFSGPSKKTSTEPEKDVASNPTDDANSQHKQQKKDNKPKKVEPEVKQEPKKKDPEPEPKKKDPEPEPKKKDPEPEPKKKDPEPEPKKKGPEPEPKKEEMKKDPPDDRMQVPMPDDIAKTEAEIRDLYKAEYAKTRPADKIALANKLMEDAVGTKSEVHRYVMMRDARNFAASAGNGILALQIAAEIATEFQVSLGKASITAAESLAAANLSPQTATECTDAILTAVDTARSADDWTSAIALARSAEAVARKSQSALLINLAQAKVKDAETMKVEAEKVKDHYATLKNNPDDPDANLAVGRFLCLIKQDWDEGLEKLAKGPVASALKLAADTDRKAGDSGEDDRVKAGDTWYDMSKSADPVAKAAMQSRAQFWYTNAAAALAGIDKVKVEKRIAELQAIMDARGGSMKRWIANRQAITDGMIKKWDFVGGPGKDFEFIPKDGAILIGFKCSITADEPPEGFQPIFLTPRGDQNGTTYGGSKGTDTLRTTKAKAGYAIGAIYIRANQTRVLALKPVYMKIIDKGLDPSKSYQGPQIGAGGADATMVGGDGNFIIGLRGKITTDNKIGALSVLTILDTAMEKKADPKGKKDPK